MTRPERQHASGAYPSGNGSPFLAGRLSARCAGPV